MLPQQLAALFVSVALLPGCAIDRGGRLRGGGGGADGALPDGGPRDVPAPDVGERPDAGPPADAGPCDPATIGSACDGDDLDRCPDDVYDCVSERAVCSSGDDDLERCGGGDEDCDPSTTEADAFDRNTYYQDSDGDRYGDVEARVLACVAPPGTVNEAMATDCDDEVAAVHPGAPEDCNARDEDCDALIDEDPIDDTACPCQVERRGAGTYLFCEATMGFTAARSFCESRGYHLVIIADMGENDFVQARADAIVSGSGWWIGLEDYSAGEGRFRWVDGSSKSYTRWDTGSGEPTDTGPGEDCVAIGSSGGRWRTERCGDARRFVCEYP